MKSPPIPDVETLTERLKSIADRHPGIGSPGTAPDAPVVWKVRPQTPSNDAAERLARAPTGPDDMYDPRCPALLKWIAKLPRAERLRIMLALSFVYPRVGHETGWQQKIARDRRLLGAETAWHEVVSGAAKTVLDLHAEFCGKRDLR